MATENRRTLSSPPAMLGLFARAAVGMIPGLSGLPLLGRRREAEVLERTLEIESRVDRDRLAAYDRVCGFTLGERLPPSYPHMLAFPLHLALISDPSFPVPAIGLVHIYNRIVQHRPILASETLTLAVSVSPLRAHPRGRQFDILTEARCGGEPVWEEVSTNLRMGGGDESAAGPSVASTSALEPTASWRLPGGLGRRYAAVSGDANPIHIHPLTARLFGFQGAIAHGMWTKARCLAALGPQLPDAFSVEVAFRRPIVLPATVRFAEERRGEELAFGVRDARSGTPHLDGLLRQSSSK
jgi:hypothetical protein